MSDNECEVGLRVAVSLFNPRGLDPLAVTLLGALRWWAQLLDQVDERERHGQPTGLPLLHMTREDLDVLEMTSGDGPTGVELERMRKSGGSTRPRRRAMR